MGMDGNSDAHSATCKSACVQHGLAASGNQCKCSSVHSYPLILVLQVQELGGIEGGTITLDEETGQPIQKVTEKTDSNTAVVRS